MVSEIYKHDVENETNESGSDVKSPHCCVSNAHYHFLPEQKSLHHGPRLSLANLQNSLK